MVMEICGFSLDNDFDWKTCIVVVVAKQTWPHVKWKVLSDGI
jgi:hypothetical protein